MKRLQLVITADDLGIDPRRDQGIFEAFAAGAVTQASLLVHGRSAAVAAAQARRVGLPLGLHLDLTETPPCAAPGSIASLLDAQGNKLGKHGLRAAIARGAVEPEHLAQEAGAQLDTFARLAGTPARHVDGHQHAHVIDAVARAIAPVLAKAGVRTTRIPAQGDVELPDPAVARFYQGVSAAAEAARAVFAAHQIYSTSAFAGLDVMGDRSNAGDLRDAVVRHRDAGSLELMCHPGYVGSGVDEFNESPAREHELRVLCSRPFTAWVAEGWLELVPFAAVEPGS